MVSQKPEAKHSPAMRSFFVRIFPWPFLLAGLCALYFGTKSVYFAQLSRSWPSAPGRIENSKVVDHTDSDGTTYHAEVSYSYQVAGIQHRANKVIYGDYGSSDPDHAQQIVNRYGIGKTVNVYYNPHQPATAVLEPGIYLRVFFVPAFGLLFSIVGAALVFKLPKLIPS